MNSCYYLVWVTVPPALFQNLCKNLKPLKGRTKTSESVTMKYFNPWRKSNGMPEWPSGKQNFSSSHLASCINKARGVVRNILGWERSLIFVFIRQYLFLFLTFLCVSTCLLFLYTTRTLHMGNKQESMIYQGGDKRIRWGNLIMMQLMFICKDCD